MERNDSFNIQKLRWTKGESECFNGMKIQHALANHSFTGLQCAIGVDPGLNWGMAFVLGQNHLPFGKDLFTLTAYWGKIPHEEVEQNYFHKIRDFVKMWLPPKVPAKVVMVEGAAHGERFGQTQLERCRLGFYEAFRELGYNVEYCPPLTCRKAVFGNGRVKGKEVWLDCNGNASDAAVLALFGSGYYYDKA